MMILKKLLQKEYYQKNTKHTSEAVKLIAENKIKIVGRKVKKLS